MSHLKIIIIKKRDYVQTASAVQQESAGPALYTAGCWGAPFPPHPAVPSCTRVTHSSRSSASTATPFPFLLVQYFPRLELGEHFYLTPSTQGQQERDLRLQRFTLAEIFMFGQLRHQIWVLCKEKILPLATEEQRCYSRQPSGTQRSRCGIPPARDKAQCQLNSLWHTCDSGVLSNHDSSVEAKWQVCPHQGHCAEISTWMLPGGFEPQNEEYALT